MLPGQAPDRPVRVPEPLHVESAPATSPASSARFRPISALFQTECATSRLRSNALRNGDAHESTAFFELPEGSEGISDGPFGTHSSSTGHVQSIVRFPNAPDHIALTISDSRKLGDGYYQSQLVIVRFAGSGSGRLRSEGTLVTRIVFDDFGGVGNYNHVAGMDIIGDILVVTGQNWSGLKSPRGQDSDNAALFFDVADPMRPKYLGKVTPTSGLGNGLDTVAITRAFDTTSKTHRYFLGMAHMNSGHASEVFSSSTMDPRDFVPYDLSPAGDFSAGFNQNTHWVVDTSGRPWGIEMSKDGSKGKVNFRKLFFRGNDDVTDGDATTAIDDDDCDWRDSAGSFVDSFGNISFLATKGHFSSDGDGGYSLRICEHRQ